MTPRDSSPEPQNALLRRVQQYAAATAVFRKFAPPLPSTHIPGRPVSKAMFLPGPSPLPVGRTVGQMDMSVPAPIPLFADNPPAAAAPLAPAVDPVAAAIDHVTQVQRSPAPAAPAPTASQPAIPSAPAVSQPGASSLDSEWGRLQRIFKQHEGPKAAAPSSTPVETPPSAPETAVSPPQAAPSVTEPTSSHPDAVQRAVHAAEAAPAPTPKAPLETMWPVSHVDAPADDSPGINDEPLVVDQSKLTIPSRPPHSPAEAEAIQRKLGDVSALGKTDSSIELHLPRRPRPAPIQAKGDKPDPNKAFWDRLRQVSGEKPAESSPSIQRTVDTEIGPLPADMWEILGETPPAAADTAVSAAAPSVQREADSRGETPAVSGAEAAVSPPQPQSAATSDQELPSFFAEAASTAPAVLPDAVQRAIAAAEAPLRQTPTSAASQATESEPPAAAPSRSEAAPFIQQTAAPEKPTIVRKESRPEPAEIPPVANSAAETPASNIQIAAPSEPELPQPTAVVQRAVDTSAEQPFSPSPTSESPAESVSSQKAASTPQSAAKQTAPALPDAAALEPGQRAANIQRAIAAAEAPPASRQTNSADAAPPPTKMSVVMPTPKSVAESGQAENVVQRRPEARPDAPETAGSRPVSVDLNAETGPLPPLPESAPPTAVSPPSSAATDAVQRAIAAAEAPAEQTDSAPITAVSTPDAAPPAAPALSPATSDAMQRAVSAAESPTPPAAAARENKPTAAAKLDVQNRPQTASPYPAELQRATTAETPPTQPEPAHPAPADAIQRAITAAEAPPIPPESAHPTSPGAIQRAIAAAEAPPVLAKPLTHKSAPTATSTPLTAGVPLATSPRSVQRAMPSPAPTETETAVLNKPEAVATPGTPTISAPAVMQRAAAIQRAIAAAEAPPRHTAWQRTPLREETAVTSPSSPSQNKIDNWPSQTITSPTIRPAAAPAIMRAPDASASPPTQPRQWPDIKPVSAAPPAVQRAEQPAATSSDQSHAEPETGNLKTDNTQEEKSAAVDIDKLAQEVYGQLKRRLAIEWERGRGKR